MIGDEHARVTEAAKAAERHLKCKVLRSSPFWRKEGFAQDMHNKEVSKRQHEQSRHIASKAQCACVVLIAVTEGHGDVSLGSTCLRPSRWVYLCLTLLIVMV